MSDATLPQKTDSESFLKKMQEGREYASMLDVRPVKIDLKDEFTTAVREIQAVRKRPCFCYVGNVLRGGDGHTSIELADDVPFSELVTSIPGHEKSADIVLCTPGGLGQQVHSFVQKLRPRFDDVAFLIPHMAMSAGTILALSGNDIIMDERGFLGPIDPQVPGKDGRFMPAQALLTLLEKIQTEGAAALKKGQNPDWSNIQILRNIDAKEIGNVLSSTEYAIQLASNYLENYKFANWTVHSDNRPVTLDDKKARAIEVATKLSSHQEWKMHSHGIFRGALWKECKIKITHAEHIDGLQPALRRLWALLYWAFENTPIQKVFLSEAYSLFRTKPTQSTP